MLFFTDQGTVYSEKAYQIPDADRTGKGLPIVNILSMGGSEKVTAALALPQFDPSHFCVLATRKGKIKRLALSDLATVRPSGLIAMGLEAGDVLRWARLTDGEDEIILVTEQGQCLRYPEEEVRPMGRAASGVTAIRLSNRDCVASMDFVEPGGFLMIVTSSGYGKRTPQSEYGILYV